MIGSRSLYQLLIHPKASKIYSGGGTLLQAVHVNPFHGPSRRQELAVVVANSLDEKPHHTKTRVPQRSMDNFSLRAGCEKEGPRSEISKNQEHLYFARLHIPRIPQQQRKGRGSRRENSAFTDVSYLLAWPGIPFEPRLLFFKRK